MSMKKTVVLSERDERVLLTLKRFDYLNIKHIRSLIGFSERYAYKVMSRLKPYVSSFTDEGVNIYYLNKHGREFTQSEKVRRRLTTAAHYMMRADMYLHLGCPESWKNEVRISYLYDKHDPKSRKIMVVADAHYITRDHTHCVVEIDNSQKMQQNRIKIEKYRRLIEKGVFKGMPLIIWVTTTPYRQKLLTELCEGLNTQIYLRGDLL